MAVRQEKLDADQKGVLVSGHWDCTSQECNLSVRVLWGMNEVKSAKNRACFSQEECRSLYVEGRAPNAIRFIQTRR